MSSSFLGKTIKRKPTAKSASADNSFGQLMKVADEVFSKYIRNRIADNKGMVECFTCPTTMRIAESDAGHYMPRAIMATRYNPINVQVQCIQCNRYEYGNTIIFRERLIEKYGMTTISNLESFRHSLAKLSKNDLLEIIATYSK